MSDDARATLQRLCAERGESLAGLSRLLGRNEAYIQQYLRKGTPRRLPERERRTLARYFMISETMLGGDADGGTSIQIDAAGGGARSVGLVPVRRSIARASAGAGALSEDQAVRPFFAFDAAWLGALTATPSEQLSMIRVEGDSMMPTLNHGDDLLVDHADVVGGLRDGIYVMRVEESLLVKRLAVHPFGHNVTVQSDNPAYPDWPDRAIEEISYIGRVIWAGHRIV